jgi:NAD+ kinase
VARIAFVAHTQRPGAAGLAEDTAAWLRSEGHEVHLVAFPTDGRQLELGPLDLAVSLGGDGTMLRTVDLVSQSDVPVLGVNMGQLGYLSAVEPPGLRDALKRFLSGEYLVEKRMTIDVSVTDDAGGVHAALRRSALNDVVLQRASAGHTMRSAVALNGDPFLTFVSDSLILCTPTGSTAYNLSARGPIVSAKARVQILTPVAAHMLFDRSVVLDAEELVSIVLIGDQPADVVVDGWLAGTLGPGQVLHCSQGQHDAKLVTFGERNLYRILKSKFNLADR